MALAGRVIASHYAEPVEREIASATPLRSGPSEEAAVIRNLARGDRFARLRLAGDLLTLAGGVAALAWGLGQPVAAFLLAVIGGAWGMSRAKRAKKERAIKVAMEGCLAQRGYQVAGWSKAVHKPAVAPPAPPVQ